MQPEQQVLYPATTKACLEVAYDNGLVNRFNPEEEVLAGIHLFLRHCPFQEQLPEIELFLASLNEDELVEVACGGNTDEFEALLKRAPPGTNELLDLYFAEEF